jgi:hypothetical protein
MTQKSYDIDSGTFSNLPKAVFEAFGESESHHLNPGRGATSVQALMLGRACSIVSNNPDHADRWRRAAADYVENTVPLNTEQQRKLREQEIYGQLVIHRENPEELTKVRKQQYIDTINSLGCVLKVVATEKNRDDFKKAIGDANELTAQVILNRKMHPGVLALPALHHHDEGREPSKNYDIALLTSVKGQEKANYRRIQVKSSKDGASMGSYSEDIYVLCGEEWFRYRQQYGRAFFPIAHLVLLESEGHLTEQQIKELDYITDGLLLDIVNSPAKTHAELITSESNN